MHKRVFFAFLLLLTVLVKSYSQFTAEMASKVDFKTINVDNLSEEQVRQISEKAKSSGMSMEQMESAALMRGMPQSEISKLKTRINALDAPKEVVPQKVVVQTPPPAPVPAPKKEPEVKVVKETIAEKEKRIFGYSLFNNDKLTFEPSLNMPTPANYQLGPGDEIVVDVWGASQQNYKLAINSEGSINIPSIGPLFISGLTIEKASPKIIGKLASIYAGLNQGSTFAQVSLGKVRSIKVNLVGDVKTPGTYTISALSTVFNALYASGGPNINGTLRDVRVYRDNKLITTLDIYDFLLKGEQKTNIRLQDQDVIYVGTYKCRVEVKGEFKRNAFYEVADKESLSDVINFAGGFNEKAYTHRVKIVRNNSRDNEIIDLSSDEFKTQKLVNGDVIVADTILSRFRNKVVIKGAVYRPGEFAVSDSVSLKTIIQKAEGLRGDACLDRATIYRSKPDFTLEAIQIDLRSLIANEKDDIQLKKDDLIRIFSIFELREKYFVNIEGEINKPDTFFYADNMKLEDLIALAGGFKESASMSRIEIARRIKNSDPESLQAEIAEIIQFTVNADLSINDSTAKFSLMPFDKVYVRRSPGYVAQTGAKVLGEVKYPGVYALSNKDERISDLIIRSGGLTALGYIKGARLIRNKIVNEKERKRLQNTLMSQSSDVAKVEISNDEDQAIAIDLERIMKKPHSKYDLILQEGDIINIPKELQTVQLNGAFLYPVAVRYDKSYGFRDYVSMAGGFSQDALRKKAYVVYANGSVKRTRSLICFKFYPRIEPGAEIIVPQKILEKKMTTSEMVGLASAITGSLSGIVTFILLLSSKK